MSLFFTLGSTVHDWGWPKNGPFRTKNGQTWQACQRPKGVQKGRRQCKIFASGVNFSRNNAVYYINESTKNILS